MRYLKQLCGQFGTKDLLLYESDSMTFSVGLPDVVDISLSHSSLLEQKKTWIFFNNRHSTVWAAYLVYSEEIPSVFPRLIKTLSTPKAMSAPTLRKHPLVAARFKNHGNRSPSHTRPHCHPRGPPVDSRRHIRQHGDSEMSPETFFFFDNRKRDPWIIIPQTDIVPPQLKLVILWGRSLIDTRGWSSVFCFLTLLGWYMPSLVVFQEHLIACV